MKVGKSMFRGFIRAVRTLNRTVSAYDAALLVCCARALKESYEVANTQTDVLHKGASVRTVADHIAHRKMAERICSKYQLTWLTDGETCVIKSHYRDAQVSVPPLVNVPTLDKLAQIDWNR